MQRLNALLASVVVAGSFLGGQLAPSLNERNSVTVEEGQAGSSQRTLVVNIGSESHVKAVNGLLFAYHALRNARGDFGTTPYRLNVKVAFGGAGVLHASSKIAHPQVNIATHPQDPVKTADSLIATLVAEGVPMLASGFALKHYDVDPSELLPGISPGNAMTHPPFLVSPEAKDTVLVNF